MCTDRYTHTLELFGGNGEAHLHSGSLHLGSPSLAPEALQSCPSGGREAPSPGPSVQTRWSDRSLPGAPLLTSAQREATSGYKKGIQFVRLIQLTCQLNSETPTTSPKQMAGSIFPIVLKAIYKNTQLTMDK